MKILRCSTFGLCLASMLLSGCKAKVSESSPTAAASPQAPSVPDFQVDPATAGSIHGSVKYSGPKPKKMLIDMSSDPACVAAHKGRAYDESLVVSGKGELGNAFVYIEKGLGDRRFAVPSTPVTIDQSGCWFRPRVLGIQVGQTLDVVNSDPVTHNIHPMAVVNHEWIHSQGPGDPPMHRTFSKVEVAIPVKCNIHGWMHADIGVVDSPYFSVTKDDGSFDLPNVPPGTYTVTAWQEKLGTRQATVTVEPSGKAVANLEFPAK